MKYLKNHNYYNDLYDKFTIQDCLKIEKSDISQSDIVKARSEKEQAQVNHLYKKAWIPVELYYAKAMRAAQKEEAIKEWMDEDCKKDQQLLQAQEPQNKKCITCNGYLNKCISRKFHSRNGDVDDILFTFKCENCDKPQGFWEDGERWKYEPTCEKCGQKVHAQHTCKKNLLITQYTCDNCNHTETDTIDLDEKYQEEIDPHFEEKRKKYCISELEGKEIMWREEQRTQLMKSIEEREKNKEKIEALEKIKKLTVFEVQELLQPIITKNEYVHLAFDKPEIRKDIFVGFNVPDAKSGRGEWDSVHDLQKLIKKALENTNWRLMSDGVSYKLGYIEGRLRDVEGEENLRKLVECYNKNKIK